MTWRGWRPRTLRWRVYLVVGGLLVLLLVTAGATTAVRLHVTSVGHRLTNTLRPAQTEIDLLAEAYIDEETGERGYLLTHDPTFLQPYYAGERITSQATVRLTNLFARDPHSQAMLTDIRQAARQWREQAIDPELAEFETGTLDGTRLVDLVGRGKELFDTLRSRLSALQERVNSLVSAALQDSSAAQSTANNVTIAAAIAAVVLAAVAAWQLRTSFAVPLNRLVGQVRRVAGGDLDHQVDASGPQEVVTVGQAVETMRARILAESARSAGVARQLARYEEAERIAGNLGDTVVRQLFTTSLALQSAASRYPMLAPVLTNATRDLDRALKDLQSAIFELNVLPGRQPLVHQVLDLVDQFEVAPEVHLAGPLEDDHLAPMAADVVGVLREALTTVVRPAPRSTVSVSTADGVLRLLISGAPTEDADAETALRERAVRLGGECTTQRDEDTVTLDWRIPVPQPPKPDTGDQRHAPSGDS